MDGDETSVLFILCNVISEMNDLPTHSFTECCIGSEQVCQWRTIMLDNLVLDVLGFRDNISILASVLL